MRFNQSSGHTGARSTLCVERRHLRSAERPRHLRRAELYAEAVAVGQPLPDMPVFLRPAFHVPVPLERTYQTTWGHYPAALKEPIEGPAG
jgi:hypothetical protein